MIRNLCALLSSFFARYPYFRPLSSITRWICVIGSAYPEFIPCLSWGVCVPLVLVINLSFYIDLHIFFYQVLLSSVFLSTSRQNDLVKSCTGATTHRCAWWLVSVYFDVTNQTFVWMNSNNVLVPISGHLHCFCVLLLFFFVFSHSWFLVRFVLINV